MKIICAKCATKMEMAKSVSNLTTSIPMIFGVYCPQHGMLWIPALDSEVEDKIIALLIHTDTYPRYVFMPTLEQLGEEPLGPSDARVLKARRYNDQHRFETSRNMKVR